MTKVNLMSKTYTYISISMTMYTRIPNNGFNSLSYSIVANLINQSVDILVN